MEKAKCVICGKEFTKVSKKQIYCGSICREIAKARLRSNRRQKQKEEWLISNNFASIELANERRYLDQFRCDRTDCKSYVKDNIYFENNCQALQNLDQLYIKTCPFYKHK